MPLSLQTWEELTGKSGEKRGKKVAGGAGAPPSEEGGGGGGGIDAMLEEELGDLRDTSKVGPTPLAGASRRAPFIYGPLGRK